MLKNLFNNISEQDKRAAIEELIHSATPRNDFFLMIVLSVIVGAFGLHLNSEAIVIGSMLIAPILSPVLGVSLGLVMANSDLLGRSLWTLFKASVFGILAAFSVTVLFYVSADELTSSIISRSEATIPYLLVAIAAGLAVAFAYVKPEMSMLLPGVAVTVALVPPLATIGIGLALFNWELAAGALILYTANIFGIVVASLIIFSLMNLYVKHRVAEKAIKKEEKALEKEQQAADKNKQSSN